MQNHNNKKKPQPWLIIYGATELDDTTDGGSGEGKIEVGAVGTVARTRYYHISRCIAVSQPVPVHKPDRQVATNVRVCLVSASVIA